VDTGGKARKRPLGIPSRRWVDNIKIDLRKDAVIWTGSIWLRMEISIRALVNIVIIVPVP
jgi:hypothetical protein